MNNQKYTVEEYKLILRFITDLAECGLKRYQKSINQLGTLDQLSKLDFDTVPVVTFYGEQLLTLEHIAKQLKEAITEHSKESKK